MKAGKIGKLVSLIVIIAVIILLFLFFSRRPGFEPSCFDLENRTEFDSCILEYSKENDNTEYCNFVSTQPEKDVCLNKVWDDPLDCIFAEATGAGPDCIDNKVTFIAVQSQNISMCTNVSTKQGFRNCEDEVIDIVASTGNLVACGDDFGCIARSVNLNKNISCNLDGARLNEVCANSKLTDTELISEYSGDATVSSVDENYFLSSLFVRSSLCGEVQSTPATDGTSVGAKDFCYLGSAFNENDDSVCDSISASDLKNICKSSFGVEVCSASGELSDLCSVANNKDYGSSIESCSNFEGIKQRICSEIND